MEIYQVKKKGNKLVKWSKEQQDSPKERLFILVTPEEARMIESSGLKVEDFKGSCHISENSVQQEQMIKALSFFFLKQFAIILEVKASCYAQFDYSSNYSGILCVGNNNQFNLSFSRLDVVYGHERERLQWERWFPLTEEGLSSMVAKIDETVNIAWEDKK